MPRCYPQNSDRDMDFTEKEMRKNGNMIKNGNL